MHLSEARFCDYLEQRFADEHGADAVERQKYLDGTGCYADFWIRVSDDVVHAVEVENDADAVRDGVSQALEYADPKNAPDDRGTVPVVYTPQGHAEDAQADALRAHAAIIEVAVPDDWRDA